MKLRRQMEQNINGGRLSHIDVAKGIGILLTVFGHCLAYAGMTGTRMFATIYAFHMPFFFFISGYLYKPREWEGFISGKVKALLLPVLIYQSLNIFFYLVLWCVGKTGWYSIVRFGAFWFLITLLYVTIAYYSADLVVGRFVKIPLYRDSILLGISVVVFAIGLVYAASIADQANQPIATTFVGVFFFSFGVFYKRYIETNMMKLRMFANHFRWIIGFVGFAALGLLYITSRWNSVTVDMNTSRYGIPFVFLLQALLGIFGLFFLSLGIRENVVLQFYGRNSLVILLVHIPVWSGSSIVCDVLHIAGYAKLVCTFAVSVGISTISVLIFNRFLPFMSGNINLEKYYDRKKTEK